MNNIKNILLISALAVLPSCSFVNGVFSFSPMGTHFYGKVIDQNEVPVKGATVRATLGSRGWFHDNISVHKDKTDDEGRFEISRWFFDKSRLRLYFEEQQGYEIEKVFFNKRANSLSTKEKPYIFHAWKGEQISLIHVDENYRFKRDGTVYSISLISGEKYQDGALDDLQISFNAPEGDGIRNASWKATLKVKNGGLIESNDTFMYLAPETGYQKEVVVEQAVSPSRYQKEITKRYYLKAKNGNLYAALKVTFDPFYRDYSLLRLEYWANPNASQNLNPDPLHSLQTKEDEYYKLGQKAFKAKNYAEAMKQLRIASEHGDRRAATLIGHLYYRGLGVSKNVTTALKWYSLALTRSPRATIHYNNLSASQRREIYDASYMLGIMYRDAIGVKKNRKKAMEYFSYTDLRGDFELGMMTAYDGIENNGKALAYCHFVATEELSDTFNNPEYLRKAQKAKNILLKQASDNELKQIKAIEDSCRSGIYNKYMSISIPAANR